MKCVKILIHFMSDIFTSINIVIATAPIVVSYVGLSRLVSRGFN